ncbi:type VII secretion-associated serine protease mycosin [Mycolicibacter sinensis]|uniref:Type VII secretion-associated serine protease mycosin n=3 Tax=Mycolicibacter TaxID=1073531 RepID=A0A1A2XTY7_MYCSD|nr:type VII secretion-associated serine protease mycosin [Mycolicibacter sinensis]
MKPSGTARGVRRLQRTAAAGAAMIMMTSGSLAGMPVAGAIDPPRIDPAALPPDGTPGPPQTMRQTSYCTEVGVLPNTDFRVQPAYMDMLNLPEAWKFSRGGGVTVAVIDTGVTPHPRLPNLIGGGDYVMGGGDGLSDCDAHGTLVASLIAAMPDNGVTPLPPPRQTRRPPSVPTNEPPPPTPAPQTTIVVMPPPPPPPAPPPVEGEEPAPGAGQAPGPAPGPGNGAAHGAASAHTTDGAPALARPAGFSGGARVVPVDFRAPSAPPPPGTAPDAFSGIAPDVQLISIRQYSAAFGPKEPFGDGQDPQLREKTDGLRTMARAIVHAANMGAQVINISQAICMNVRTLLDQADLGAAVRYAAVEKNVVIVAAAGDTSWRDCKQNPTYNAMRPDDPRDWNGVNTVVTPAWYDEYVLTVGAVDSAGAPLGKSSVAGPWVSIAAPGTDIEGLSPRDDGLMNAVDGPENSLLVPSGTSFSTAIVSGVAALVRAKYPELSSHQVINRLIRTARPPARGVDNVVGYGIVDPVAALTWDVPDGPAQPPERLSAPLQVPPMPPERDMTPVWVAGAGLLTALAAAGVALGVAALRRSRRNR